MPRIRTLKPEHRQHRKVGPLDHVTYRLWVGMILEADDEGRLVYDPDALRVLIFGYHPKVTRGLVEASTQRLSAVGLIVVYGVDGQNYAWFPSWRDHQKIDRPRPSLLPCYDTSTSVRRFLDEPSSLIGSDLDRIGRDRIRPDQGPRDVDAAATWSTADWGTPEALAYAYNTLATDNVFQVTKLTPKRRKLAVAALAIAPDRAWWAATFEEYHRSRFLSGKVAPSNGHAAFCPDFDWLLASGKDGIENFAKVHDGRYRQ